MFRVVTLIVIAVNVGAAVAQVPESASPAQTLLQPPAVELPAEPEGELTKRPGWYGAGGVLVAVPMFFDGFGRGRDSQVMVPLPSPWAALGYRRASDVSWQTSFLLVPLYHRNDLVFNIPYAITALGFDIDRISTNRSETPGLDRRWQVGLRTVGAGLWGIPIPFGIGPHAGLRLERRTDESVSIYAWGDVGVLPTLGDGVPLLNLRAELGFKWHPPAHPGVTVSLGAFNEYAGILAAGFMTPGVTVKVAWKY